MAATEIPSDTSGTFQRIKEVSQPINKGERFGKVYFSGQWNDQNSSVQGIIRFLKTDNVKVRTGDIICRVDSAAAYLLEIKTSVKEAIKKKRGAAKKKAIKSPSTKPAKKKAAKKSSKKAAPKKGSKKPKRRGPKK